MTIRSLVVVVVVLLVVLVFISAYNDNISYIKELQFHCMPGLPGHVSPISWPPVLTILCQLAVQKKINTRRSYSKKVTRRSFGGLFWPPKRNRYNFWTIGNISTKFHRCITYMVRILKICENLFFQDGGQHGRRNSESNVSQLSFQIQRQIKCRFI